MTKKIAVASLPSTVGTMYPAPFDRPCLARERTRLGDAAGLTQFGVNLLRLPPGAFTPPPKVWSAIVGLVPHAVAPDPALFAAMERTTAAAFGQRRKMLRGSLKSLGHPEALLEAAGIAGTRRAETLSVAEFDALARVVAGRS